MTDMAKAADDADQSDCLRELDPNSQTPHLHRTQIPALKEVLDELAAWSREARFVKAPPPGAGAGDVYYCVDGERHEKCQKLYQILGISPEVSYSHAGVT